MVPEIFQRLFAQIQLVETVILLLAAAAVPVSL
jgi:hypothetical protein